MSIGKGRHGQQRSRARGGAARAAPSLQRLLAHRTHNCNLKIGSEAAHVSLPNRTIGSSGTDWQPPSDTPPALFNTPLQIFRTTPRLPPSAALPPHCDPPPRPAILTPCATECGGATASSCSPPPPPPAARPSVCSPLPKRVVQAGARAPLAAVAQAAVPLPVIDSGSGSLWLTIPHPLPPPPLPLPHPPGRTACTYFSIGMSGGGGLALPTGAPRPLRQRPLPWAVLHHHPAPFPPAPPSPPLHGGVDVDV